MTLQLDTRQQFPGSGTNLSFRERLARALDGVPAKVVARVAGVTPKAAERRKAGDNSPNAEALTRLCAEFDACWDVVRQQSCRSVDDAERMLGEVAELLAKRGKNAPR